MHIAIVWTSVSLNEPIRGVCIPYSDDFIMNTVTGLPEGRWHAFLVKSLAKVSSEETTYGLYKLTDDEINLLLSERKLAMQINGPIINHDLSFAFSTGQVDKANMFVSYKPFTPNKNSEIDVFKASDIVNPQPWNVVQGTVVF